EGRGAGTALPAGHGRSAIGRRHDFDFARTARAVRSASRRADQGFGAGGGGGAVQSLYFGSLSTGQGHRPGGRNGGQAADGDRLHANGAGRNPSPADAAGNRARSAQEGERSGVEGTAGQARKRVGRSERARGQPQGAVASGEGRGAKLAQSPRADRPDQG